MKKLSLIMGCLMALIFLRSDSCDDKVTPPQANSGVQQVSTSVATGIDGHTVEQDNIINRLKMDNMPGSIKHLYIISAYSGQVIMYSTVKGKVTSSGKRISPTLLAEYGGGDWHGSYHPDMIQDDGTYGNSVDYIYWWDSKNSYHQLYITGGMIVQISSQPIAVKNITINMELSSENN